MKNWSHQLHYNLTSKQAFGTSRHEAKKQGTAHEKIFSFKTYQTYKKQGKYFIAYIKERHPNCKNLMKAKKYVNEYLSSLVSEGKSAWTIKTARSALNKIFQISVGDRYFFVAPSCRRADIKRSRGSVKSDSSFSVVKNAELIDFARSTGLRRSGLSRLKGKDLFDRDRIEDSIKRIRALDRELTKEEKRQLDAFETALLFREHSFVFVKEKGGRIRLAPIVGPNQVQTIERIQNTLPEARVWPHVPSNVDIHSYRAEYAQIVYEMYARPIETIPYDRINKGSGRAYQSEVYCCRADEKGRRLDKRAMWYTSKALGHNRINVVAKHYLYGM